MSYIINTTTTVETNMLLAGQTISYNWTPKVSTRISFLSLFQPCPQIISVMKHIEEEKGMYHKEWEDVPREEFYYQ